MTVRRGISKRSHEKKGTVKDVGKLLGVDITENDISASHRMPQSQKHKGKPGPPAIIVKFARRDVKDNFYRARKQLKDLTTQRRLGTYRCYVGPGS